MYICPPVEEIFRLIEEEKHDGYKLLASTPIQ
jgi:hypothetical protein